MIRIAATYVSDSGKVDYIMKLVPLGDRVVIKALHMNAGIVFS